jgi:hypothetical protein
MNRPGDVPCHPAGAFVPATLSCSLAFILARQGVAKTISRPRNANKTVFASVPSSQCAPGWEKLGSTCASLSHNRPAKHGPCNYVLGGWDRGRITRWRGGRKICWVSEWTGFAGNKLAFRVSRNKTDDVMTSGVLIKVFGPHGVLMGFPNP